MTFTRDWSHTRVHWPGLFSDFEPKEILEIGCFEGQATRWMLDRWPAARVMVVDRFDIDAGQYDRFLANVPEASSSPPRCCTRIGSSETILEDLLRRRFDLVYVDGDHSAPGVLSDAVRAFRHLQPGGWMLFDDYHSEAMPGVVTAVDAFRDCYEDLLASWDGVGVDQYLMVKA